MIRFLLSRLAQSIVVLFLLSIVMFSLIHFMPGDYKSKFALENPGYTPTEEDLEAYKKKLGLDKPIYIQYLRLMTNIVTGDFGVSERYQVSISSLLPHRIINTLKLTIPVLLLSLAIAIPIGVFTAVYQYTKFDYITNLLIFLGISIPTFWTGLIAIYFFSLKLQIFPASGIGTINISSTMDQAKHYFLPVLVLSSHGIGSWVRYLRGNLLEILNLDYIRTARAKGLVEDQIIFKHALKNALIPLVTLVALSIPHLVSGALITEEIFGIPGMGQLLINSILEKDREMALTAFMLLAVLTLFFNLVADFLYGFIDPRIKKG